MRRACLLVLSSSMSTMATAGEVPLTQPAPAWVAKAPLDAATATSPDAPELLVLDTQARIENGQVWTYTDRALRVTSAEALNQMATLTLPWAPDKGDLIIHDVTILRDGKEIDLLTGGAGEKKAFTVLRREQSLEQLEYTGVLTATLPAEGLRVGDTLRLRYSVTMRDAALGGRAQTAFILPAAPLRIGFARTRVQWDARSAAHWQAKGEGVVIKPVRNGAFTQIDLVGPLVKQPDRPADAPARFRGPPLLEASTFADWADVSRVMAPLYATDGLIAPDSPLAAELVRIKAAPTPIERAQRALRLVQDDIRYFAVSMDGGNYVPQKPAETWAKRYGDCKAKTLMLLALLRASGIEAEAVLASAAMGDMVPGRLPAAGAFDHVLVRATIDGQSLWLDGTGSGARIEDIRDTPAFGHVLPLRMAGATLLDLPMRAMGRPVIAVSLDIDESSSVDLPSAFTAKAVLRGPMAAPLSLVAAKLDARQRAELVRQFFTGTMRDGQFADPTLSIDAGTGTATLTARGLLTTPWAWDDKRMRRSLSRLSGDLAFAPDRARTDWAGIPVAIPGPLAVQFDMTLRLPEAGKGFTVEGRNDATAQVAGRTLTRRMTLDKGMLTLSERLDSPGGEIAADAIPAERDKVEVAMAAMPRLVAPVETPRRWDLPAETRAKQSQLALIDSIYTAMIRDVEPGDPSPFQNRASLRRGIGDYAGAIADLTSALAIAPDADTYLQRSRALYSLNRLKEALADAQKARALDPASSDATQETADLLAETGDMAGATALLDQKIALGGPTRDGYKLARINLIGQFGDPLEALRQIDALIAEKPGKPSLLNARCWIKGTRSVMLDGALKDCTSAIELSEQAYEPLDSRALIWLRMGRYTEALADLDAVLLANPGLAESRFLRGIVRARLAQQGPAAEDLLIARRLNPGIDRVYARYGIAAGRDLALTAAEPSARIDGDRLVG